MSVMKQDLANGVRNTFMIMQFLWSDGDKDDEFIKCYEYEQVLQYDICINTT